MSGRLCRFVTFGCKINQYDTQGIREAVLANGFEEADGAGPVDVVVVNACTVTQRAGDKGVAAVARLARTNPDAQIIVTGCLSPSDRAALDGIERVAHVVGNEEKDQIPALIQGAALEPTEGRKSRRIFNLEASRFEGHTRAFLKVHDGCDDFCTYCIIPFLRGKSMSRSIEDVVAEAHRYAEAGYREVVVTGIHLRRYGSDLGLEGGVGMLLSHLREVPGIDRVRLSSIGERTFTPEFLDRFRADPGLCPFFHIPLQSGSDSVLRRMRREYTRDEYLDAVTRIREALPHAVITTDFMVGFPGETDAEFEESLETARRAEFAFMHIFPYSRREGTKAAKLPDPVESSVKAARMRRARVLEDTWARSDAEARLGATTRVLVERHERTTAAGLGREGLKIVFETGVDAADRSLWNQEVDVQLDRLEGRTLHGHLVGENVLGSSDSRASSSVLRRSTMTGDLR